MEKKFVPVLTMVDLQELWDIMNPFVALVILRTLKVVADEAVLGNEWSVPPLSVTAQRIYYGSIRAYVRSGKLSDSGEDNSQILKGWDFISLFLQRVLAMDAIEKLINRKA